MSLYQPGIPTGSVDLDIDYLNLQHNFTQLDTTYKVDHIPLTDNTGNNGFHIPIHIVASGGDPAAVAGTYIVYDKQYTPNTTGGVADTQLFGRTAGGGVSQLTGNLAQSEGWNWVGGVLLQWGKVTSAGIATGTDSGTVTFKDRVTGAIPFPKKCFVVLATNNYTVAPTGGRTGTVSISQIAGGLTNLKFDWSFTGASGAATGFFWYAIGN